MTALVGMRQGLQVSGVALKNEEDFQVTGREASRRREPQGREDVGKQTTSWQPAGGLGPAEAAFGPTRCDGA